MKFSKMTAMLSLILLAIVVVPAISAVPITVTRDLPGSGVVGVDFDVDLVVDVDEADKPSVYILKETVPVGFSVISTGGAIFDSSNRELKWLVIDGFLSGVVEDITYTYTVRTSDPGTHDFSGTVQDESTVFDVAGDTQVSITESQDIVPPTVGGISPVSGTTNVAQTYSVGVSDDNSVNSCVLVVDGAEAATMTVPASCTSCTASVSHSFGSAGTKSVFASCLDSSGNQANGSAVNIVISNPPADTTPPTISNVVVGGVTATSATITWTTNEASTSVVEHGTTTSYGQSSSSGTLTTSHSITLTGLSPNTLYHFRVKSVDASSNTEVGVDRTFTTAITTNPKISVSRDLPGIATPSIPFGVTLNVDVNESSTPNSYTISETVPVGFDVISTGGASFDASTRILKWRVIGSPFLGTTIEDTSFTYSLQTSNPGSFDFSGTVVISEGIFSVTGETSLTVGSDETAPIISNVLVSNIGENSATITWTTNENSNSIVEYGTTTAYGLIASNSNFVTSHSVTLTGLNSDNNYHFRVRSTDASLNQATGVDDTFTTLEGSGGSDTTPPVISNVQITGITTSGATVTWTTNEPATSIVDFGLTTSYGSSESSSALVTSHSVTLSGLGAGTSYHLIVKSADSSSNQASGTDKILTTLQTVDTTAPTISNVQVTSITATTAIVTWTTNEAATSKVEFGPTTSYGSENGDTGLVTSHSVLLTGLDPETDYHYMVISADGSGNSNTGSDRTFTTGVLDVDFPVTLSSVQILDNNFLVADTIPSGGQFNVKVVVSNTDSADLTPMVIVQILDGTTPVNIGTVKSTISSGGSSEITVGFNLPIGLTSGKVYTVKVFAWNKWISQGGWQALAQSSEDSFAVA